MLVKENLAFRKYKPLEVRHDVNLGHAYKTKDSAKQFTYYIAESQKNGFIQSLSTVRFYSFLWMDRQMLGTLKMSYCSYVLQERCIVSSERIKSCVRYFSIREPKSKKADADGLIYCLTCSLEKLDITNVLDKENVLGVTNKPVLIGGGTDGAAVNVSEQNGMFGKMKKELSWIFWACAHRSAGVLSW